MLLRLFLLSFALGCHSLTTLPLRSLSWNLTNGTTNVAATVPGGVYSDLLRAGILKGGDCYYRYNDLNYRWVSHQNWTYSTSIPVSMLTKLKSYNKIVLMFEGIDTVSEIKIDNLTVGSTNNMFVKYIFDVTNQFKIHNGETLSLSVIFTSPVVYARDEYERQREDYVVPPKCVPPEYKGECHANHIRKMQSSFAWDWGPAFPSMGIWKGVSLIGLSSVFLKDVTLDYDSTETFPITPTPGFQPSWRVKMKMQFITAGAEGGARGKLKVLLDNQTIEETHLYVAGNCNNITTQLHEFFIPRNKVDLWWPVGLGKQNLYNITISWTDSITSESSYKTLITGFRKVELDQSYLNETNKQLGRHYRLKVNNVTMFLRGSNWIPSHVLPEMMSDDHIQRLLADAAATHQNAIRVWGGGIYESDAFYSATDRLGIVVWQDMMFACSMYPAKKSFLSSVAEEVATQISRLGHHPSIVVWAANNENEAALRDNWYGTSFNFNIYKKDYVSLYVETIRQTVGSFDSRPFVVSSPSNGVESEEEGYIAKDPYSPIYGDVHYYNYMKNAWQWQNYPVTRMMTEYGFQSWPSFRTLSKVTNGSDWFIDSPMMNHRQHHPFGNLQLKHQVSVHMVLPDSGDKLSNFKDYLYLTQVHQAMAVKTQTERYRREMSSVDSNGQGFTSGSLYWQLNDIWQGASWSSIEFGGRWKILHYFAKLFFSPVLLSPYVNGEKLEISVVNDRVVPLESFSLDLQLRSYQQLQPLKTYTFRVEETAPMTAKIIYSKDLMTSLQNVSNSWIYEPKEECFVTLNATIEGVEYAPFVLLEEPKNSAINKANITLVRVTATDENNTTFLLTLETNYVALFVLLETDIEGTFSDNGFLLSQPRKDILFNTTLPIEPQIVAKSVAITTLSDTYDVMARRVEKMQRKVKEKLTGEN